MCMCVSVCVLPHFRKLREKTIEPISIKLCTIVGIFDEFVTLQSESEQAIFLLEENKIKNYKVVYQNLLF